MKKLLNKLYLIALSLFTPLIATMPSFNSANETNAVNSNFIYLISYKDSVKYLPFSSQYYSQTYGPSNSMTSKKQGATFTDYKIPYMSLDDFYCGEVIDSPFKMETSTFQVKQERPYIGFTFAGSMLNESVYSYVLLNVSYTNTDGERKTYEHKISSKDEVTAPEDDTGVNKGKVGTFSSMMMPRFFKLPEDLVEGTAKLTITKATRCTAPFGALQINMTAFDCAEFATMYLMARKPDIDESGNTPSEEGTGIYSTYEDACYNRINISMNALANSEYKCVFDGYKAGPNCDYYNKDFEDGSWMMKWGALQQANYLDDISFSSAICDAKTSSIDNMPYNQTNNKFFRANSLENNDGDNKGSTSGYTSSAESKSFALLSKAFIINSDFISVKLSGNNVEFQLADADEVYDLGVIKTSYDLTNLDTKNISKSDVAPVTMSRYIINTSAYKGHHVRFAITNSGDGEQYSSFNMDDIVTKYSSDSFIFDVETYTQTSDSGTTYGSLLDHYIVPETYNDGASTYVDPIPEYKEAYDFLSKYYSTLRSKEHGASFCDMLNSKETLQILNDYNSLSDKAAKIVDRSMDFNHGNKSTPTTWFNQPVNKFEMKTSIDYLLSQNKMSNVHRTPNETLIDNNSNIMVIAIICVVSSILICGVFYLNNKKEKENI